MLIFAEIEKALINALSDSVKEALSGRAPFDLHGIDDFFDQQLRLPGVFVYVDGISPGPDGDMSYIGAAVFIADMNQKGVEAADLGDNTSVGVYAIAQKVYDTLFPRRDESGIFRAVDLKLPKGCDTPLFMNLEKVPTGRNDMSLVAIVFRMQIHNDFFTIKGY